MKSVIVAIFGVAFLSPVAAETVSTVDALVAAIRDGAEGSEIELSEGTFELKAPLEPKTGMTISGAGAGKTIITHDPSWKASAETLPDPEMTTKGMDTQAYLFRLQDKAANVTISGMTLRGPQVHGAIFGQGNENLHLHHLTIDTFMWCGIRTFSMSGAKIHDCEFIDAGGKWKKGGIPGTDGGISAGAIFAIWVKDSEISHNRFTRTRMAPEHAFFGIKGRQGKRCRIHHNTIEVDFSIEFPFENDEDMEIDHNLCRGAISIPKYSGGAVPESGMTFHIHHNWFLPSYAIEFVRNGVEIDHNLFDFDPQKDGGNLISAFGNAAAKGPAKFHHNLVKNPGRGVIWINEPYDNLEIFNNHIITNTTVTPRTEGLFGFNAQSDLSSIRIKNNIIECIGQARPLLRFKERTPIAVENNQFLNVSDEALYPNPQTDAPRGLENPLSFTCGVHDEITVTGWEAKPTKK